MITSARTREEIVSRLNESEAEIRRLGVLRLALFGSFVRGEGDDDSDVDLVTTEALSPFIGPHILAEAEDVLQAA